jgi:hypothetical protein
MRIDTAAERVSLEEGLVSASVPWPPPIPTGTAHLEKQSLLVDGKKKKKKKKQQLYLPIPPLTNSIQPGFLKYSLLPLCSRGSFSYLLLLPSFTFFPSICTFIIIYLWALLLLLSLLLLIYFFPFLRIGVFCLGRKRRFLPVHTAASYSLAVT